MCVKTNVIILLKTFFSITMHILAGYINRLVNIIFIRKREMYINKLNHVKFALVYNNNNNKCILYLIKMCIRHKHYCLRKSVKTFLNQCDLWMSKNDLRDQLYWIFLMFQPAHVKACFLGSSLSIPITDGKLALGTWQGIWLGEHRDHAGSRKLVVTLTGVLRDSARSPLSPVSPIASTSS